MLLGWGVEIWALAAGAALVGGAVRGFTGFGFALIFITAVALLAAPAEIVPISTVLDMFAGIRLLPHVWKDVDKRGAGQMFLGALPAVPFGTMALAVLSPDVMRIGIGILVLVATAAIAFGVGLRRVPGTRLKLATGATMGFLSGSTGIPGPPVVLLYLSSPLPVATLRATASAVFLIVDAVAVTSLAIYGLITVHVLLHCLVLAPVVEGAVWLGRRLFGVADEAVVRRASLVLMAALAVVAIARAAIA